MNHGNNGIFITLEGIEGAGKTTLMVAIKAYFESLKRHVVCVREPGGTNTGDLIRNLVMTANEAIHPRAELLLFCASRAQLIEEKIKPTLAAGGVVLCDRYTDSTLAYQGYGRGLSMDLLKGCNQIATDGLIPHLTLLIDLPLEVGLGRAKKRQGDGPQDRFESEAVDFHRRIQGGYRALAKTQPHRFQVLDGELTPEALAKAAIHALQQRLELP